MTGPGSSWPGALVGFRLPFAGSIVLPALVLVTFESGSAWSAKDRVWAGTWNWPDPPDEGCAHLAVFQPLKDGIIEFEANVPWGDEPGCWKELG